MFEQDQAREQNADRPSVNTFRPLPPLPARPPPSASSACVEEEVAGAVAEEARPGLLHLPVEVLIKIFSHLGPRDLMLGVGRTCRRLYNIHTMPDFWKRLTLDKVDHRLRYLGDMAAFRYYSGIINHKVVSFPVRGVDHDPASPAEEDDGGGVLMKDRGDHTDNIASSRVERVETIVRCVIRSLTERFADNWPSLSRLSIVNGLLYPALEDLTLEGDYFPDPDFLSSHTRLRSLRVVRQMPWYPTTGTVEKFAAMLGLLRSCTSLRTLDIKMGTVDRTQWRPELVNRAVMDFAASGPEELCHLALDAPLDDDVIGCILDSCPRLQTLNVRCSELTMAAFRQVLDKPHSSLRALRLKHCPLHNHRLVYAIQKSFPQLTELELSFSVSDRALASPLLLSNWREAFGTLAQPRFFPHLTALRLKVRQTDAANLPQVTHHGSLTWVDCLPQGDQPQEVESKLVEVDIDDLTQSFPFNFDCLRPNLKILTLRGTSQRVFLDEEVQTLVRTCPTLRELCVSPSAATLSGLETFSQLPLLNKLHCSLAREVGAPVRRSRSAADPQNRLRELHIAEWPDVSGDKLVFLSKIWPRLISLTIDQCPSLLDSHVLAALLSFPELHTLSLDRGAERAGDPGTTEKALHYALMHGEKLRHLTFRHALQLDTPHSVSSLWTHVPRSACLEIRSSCITPTQLDVSLCPNSWDESWRRLRSLARDTLDNNTAGFSYPERSHCFGFGVFRKLFRRRRR